MGWAARVNPNSEWYKKRHPEIEIKTEIKPEIKRKTFWQWLKNLLNALLK